MIKEIPEGQLCQAFDPMVSLSHKAIRPDLINMMNTSCVAPAFVYLEGSRGKRFLCDFHYVYERNMTNDFTPNIWPDVEGYIFEKLETIVDTFDKTATVRTFKELCWCQEEAFVKVVNDQVGEDKFFCNFHWRKTYYRSLSNNFVYAEPHNIIDERILSNQTIKEEYNKKEKLI